jgi:hypothetical protein
MGVPEESVRHDRRSVPGAFRLRKKGQEGWALLVEPLLETPSRRGAHREIAAMKMGPPLRTIRRASFKACSRSSRSGRC